MNWDVYVHSIYNIADTCISDLSSSQWKEQEMGKLLTYIKEKFSLSVLSFFQHNYNIATWKKMPAAPGIPSLSPTQVLTGPNNAWLQRSDEFWYIHCGMAAGDRSYLDCTPDSNCFDTSYNLFFQDKRWSFSNRTTSLTDWIINT